MNTSRIERALHRAREDLDRAPRSAPENRRARRRHVAIGDPQADITKVLAILEHQGVLDDSGRISEDVHLVSMGDHFDWGTSAERARATTSASLLIAWLAAHPADQVTLLVGNHDLARVGELAQFDGERFRSAQEEAERVYRGEDPEAERTFLERYPEVPTAEVLARDFAAFEPLQREWVDHLLRSRRFRVAAEHGGLLLTHAGITLDELRGRVADGASATAIAAALNAALEAAVDHWSGGPLHLPGLHRPGSATGGEGVGIFYHRASLLPEDAWSRGISPPRRRFDPRRLPRGITQVIGHVRDAKSRSLLGANPREAWDGVLRHLWTDGVEVHYGHGTGETPTGSEAAMIFVDGSMRDCPIAEYELLDLDRRRPFEREVAEST